MSSLRRKVALGAVLAVTAVVVPDAAQQPVETMLVKVRTAKAVAHSDDVVWVLALGSDARPGDPPLRSRADAIHLIGANLVTGAGTIIGIPRDSYVDIPGHGTDKINAGLYHGGPEAMAEAVEGLVGITPDYVFTTTFGGLVRTVDAIGGITVYSPRAFSDDNLPGNFRAGMNPLDGLGAINFSRMRHYLPRGDFDRSANQQQVLLGILREMRADEDVPGWMERGTFSTIRNVYTDLSPAELSRLGQALTQVEPRKVTPCVLQGSIGYAGAASVVFPDVAQAQRLGDEARDDATLDGC